MLRHFPNSTYSELKRRKEQLEDICQNAIVTMPRSNTDIFLQEQVISRGKIALIFMAVIGITMIQLITEWIIVIQTVCDFLSMWNSQNKNLNVDFIRMEYRSADMQSSSILHT